MDPPLNNHLKAISKDKLKEAIKVISSLNKKQFIFVQATHS